jgi:hypothetical protein
MAHPVGQRDDLYSGVPGIEDFPVRIGQEKDILVIG